jgi:hypothetical protein
MDEVLNTQWPKEKGQIKAKNTSQKTGDYLIWLKSVSCQ